MLIVVSETSRSTPPPPSQRDTDRISHTLAMFGCRVLEVPSFDPEDPLTLDDYFSHLPVQATPAHGLYNGFIPSASRYQEVYDACARRNIELLNSPAACSRALSLVQAYPHLRPWTPATHVITDLEDLEHALDIVGLPAFLKGGIKSLKGLGPRSCVAETLADARRIATELFARTHYTQGQIVLRAWIDLAHTQTTAKGFPIGREYRVFLYQDEVLALGYYWDTPDPFGPLSAEEEREVCSLARRASRALDVPYVSIDIGQTTDQEFVVIEPGDAQFAGLGLVEPLELYGQLIARLRDAPAPRRS